MADDYCELCDLPLSTCVHGMPAPPPAPPSAPSAPARRTTTARRPAASTRSAPAARPPKPPPPRTLTPPEALRPHILAVLDEAGGTADADEVYAHLEARLADTLLERDRQTTPEGELRWRTAARRARQSLIAEGVLAPGPGVWALADR